MSDNQQQQQGGGATTNTIQLDEMSLDQLDQLKQREENRMQLLTTRYAQLRSAAARLMSSQTAVQELQDIFENNTDKNQKEESKTTSSTNDVVVHDLFVPLTESVYVPGKIRCNEPGYNHLLVELGTGYFVEQTPNDTIQYINRKIRLVDANSNNVTTAVQSTKHNLDQITMAMQGKLLEIRARQEGQRHRTAMEE